MNHDSDIIRTAMVIGGALFLLLIFMLVLSTVFGIGLGIDGEVAFTPAAGENVTVTDGDVDTHTVALTRGYAADFDRSEPERYVAAPVEQHWHEDNFSVFVTATLGEDANAQAAYTAFAADNGSVIIQYEDGQWLGYVNDSDRTVSATVPFDPGNRTAVMLTYNSEIEELHIEAAGEEDTAIANSLEEDRMLAADWVGSIDEVRVIDGLATDADRTQYADDGVQVLPDSEGAQAARLMFNEGEGDTTEVYYTDRTAQLVGVGWTDGLPGPDLVEGTDYTVVDTEPFTIQPLAGGLLDGAPTAFVEHAGGAFSGLVTSLVNVGTSAFSLLVVALLVMGASAILRTWNGGGFGGR